MARRSIAASLRIALAAIVLACAGQVALIAPPAAAQNSATIQKIVVTGNKRIEPQTIASYMTVKVGDPFDPQRIDDSLKSLFATGLFADVTIRREGDTLVVHVVENPIINRIAFEGNKAIKTSDLENEVQLKPRTVYTRTKVQNDVARILELYRRKGRFSATVDPQVIRRPDNRVDLIFEIDEGKPTRVREINFVGNHAFSASTLREHITTKETAWWRFFSTADTYDPDRLSYDEEMLRRFYLSKGFADFRVLSVVAELSPDRRNFYVTFTIEEGPRYKFGDVKVTSTLHGLDPKTVQGLVTTDSGDWYNARKVENVVQDITTALGNRGFPFVDVQPKAKRDRKKLTINVDYDISEGPKIYVERINIFGNTRTADGVIRREFKLAEGDAFNKARLQRSEQRIRALDFFSKVDVTTEPGSQPDTTVINVNVKEKSTGQLSLGAGFSTFDKVLFNASISERNLLGTGNKLTLDLAVSSRRQTIDLAYTDPYFLNRQLEAGFDIFKRRLDLRRESSYAQDSLGTVLHMGYPMTEHLKQTLFYTLKKVTVSDVPSDASIYVQEQAGTTTVSEVSQQLTYDRRDDPNNPTSGYMLQQGTDLAGLGGSTKYLRNRVGASLYYPFALDWTGVLESQAGIIHGLEGQSVGISDRFYVGGTSLRGFAPSGIGPRDLSTGDALGGNVFWTAKAELGFPLGLPRELGLTGRVFNDWGTLFGTDETGSNVTNDHSLRSSIGIGLSYQSPLGPIRVDFARPILRKNYDRTQFFSFSFGTTF